jgi:hypothetical protein
MTVDRRIILRGHAAFLMLLTFILTTLTYVGFHAGVGPYADLADPPLILVGYVQAYPLMGLVGVAMWIGSYGATPGRFSLLAIAAHLIPLFTLATMWEPVMASSIASKLPLSFAIHGGGIAAELVSQVFGRDESPR